ncbi:hypothetical protein OG758_15025 [Streptomyces sp. NBC_01474]|uniref:hypothetical protein n=1 Tax=unclassified Streptomyces TaxID=2593676 RepID=UPI002DD7B401|nr:MULTISPECIES: hypothetical protein [unclassified Streptomyces]WSD95318.1 hypothetical protein OG758_15025 [Streptomyces sp. NBC_01474]
MADEESSQARGEGPSEQGPSHPDEQMEAPLAEFRMEMRDRFPGGRAVIGVEQEGEFVWLASRQHVTEQARDEFVDQLQRIVNEGWWVQNWPGRS